MEKTIVIGCSTPGYAIMRALAGKNIHIIGMTTSDLDEANLSKYVSEVVDLPRPERDEERFIAILMENAPRWEGALVLETSDSKAVALSQNKEKLSRYYRIVTPPWETLRIFIEKEKTYALARELDIPFPASIPLIGRTDVNGISGIRYPALLKPVRSFEFVSRFHAKNFPVNNDDELKAKFKLCVEAGQNVILQELIPGSDDNLYKMHGYVNSQGKLVGRLFSKKLRQRPATFGVMRVGVTTERTPEIEELTERLLQGAHYRGYFNSEFKWDPRDGKFKLIEVNCRLPRGGMLPIAAGVNYPWIIFSDLVRNQQIDAADYKRDCYWIELYADLAGIRERRNREDISLRDYLKPYLARHKVFADLDVRDPGPFMKATGQKVRNALRRIFRKITGRQQSRFLPDTSRS